MKHILIKDLPYSVLCLVAVAGGWLTYFIDRGPGALHPQASYMLGFFIVVGACGALINREFAEQTGHYAFLRSLPVTDREIVTAKFAVALFDVCLSWTLVMLALSLFESGPGELAVHAAYVSLWCVLALVITSFWLMGIYGLGMGIPGLVMSLLLLVVLLPLSLVLDQAFDFHETLGFPGPVYELSRLHWTVWLSFAALVLLMHYGFLRIAARIKRVSDVYL
jgi:hypothetical protein